MDYPDALPKGFILASEFAIDSVLGQGGFGITYKALDRSIGRPVAIKEYFPQAFAIRDEATTVRSRNDNVHRQFQSGLQRFIQEAHILGSLDHPNIVRVHRVFSEHDTAYIVMEFVEGCHMDDWLRGLSRTPSQSELDSLVAKLLDALQLIHRNKIIHRDVKPDNIFIRSSDDEPVLLDFGAAKLNAADGRRSTYQIVTPFYSPIEAYAADGDHHQGPHTDIYGLAATIYRALSGRPPPDAPTRMAHDTLVPPGELPGIAGNYRDNFIEAVAQGLRVRSSERPATIKIWREALFREDGAAPVRDGEAGSPGGTSADAGASAAAEGGSRPEAAARRSRERRSETKRGGLLVPMAAGIVTVGIVATGAVALVHYFENDQRFDMAQLTRDVGGLFGTLNAEVGTADPLPSPTTGRGRFDNLPVQDLQATNVADAAAATIATGGAATTRDRDLPPASELSETSLPGSAAREVRSGPFEEVSSRRIARIVEDTARSTARETLRPNQISVEDAAPSAPAKAQLPLPDDISGPIVKMAASHDGSRAALATKTGDVIVWNVLTGEIINRLPKAAQRITALAVRDDLLAFADQDGIVHAYRGGRRLSQTRSGAIVTDLAVPEGGRKLHAVVQISGGKLQFQSIDVNGRIDVVRLLYDGLGTARFSEDAQFVAMQVLREAFVVDVTATGRPVPLQDGTSVLARSAEMVGRRMFAIDGKRRSIRLYDLSSGALLNEFGDGVSVLSDLPGGQLLAALKGDTIEYRNVATGRVVAAEPLPAPGAKNLFAVGHRNPRHFWVAAVYRDGTVRVIKPPDCLWGPEGCPDTRQLSAR